MQALLTLFLPFPTMGSFDGIPSSHLLHYELLKQKRLTAEDRDSDSNCYDAPQTSTVRRKISDTSTSIEVRHLCKRLLLCCCCCWRPPPFLRHLSRSASSPPSGAEITNRTEVLGEHLYAGAAGKACGGIVMWLSLPHLARSVPLRSPCIYMCACSHLTLFPTSVPAHTLNVPLHSTCILRVPLHNSLYSKGVLPPCRHWNAFLKSSRP